LLWVPGQGVEAGAGVFGLGQRGSTVAAIGIRPELCRDDIGVAQRGGSSEILRRFARAHRRARLQQLAIIRPTRSWQSLALLGKADEAVAEIKRALELFEASGGVVPGWAYASLAFSYFAGPRSLKRG
jgi:hypothetical protein